MFKIGDKVIFKGIPNNFRRLDQKAVIIKKTVEASYFVIKLQNGAEILTSTDFLTLDSGSV